MTAETQRLQIGQVLTAVVIAVIAVIVMMVLVAMLMTAVTRLVVITAATLGKSSPQCLYSTYLTPRPWINGPS